MVDFLASRHVTHVFETAGGSIAHLLDSLHGRHDVVTVSMHHEQAAAFAAEGYARACGRPGVAMATSGPGATNLVTGIGSCYFDSIPALFVTGQVNTYEYRFDRPVRQIGFQETDIVSVVRPLVKEAKLVTDAGDIRLALERLMHVACAGRPGPVLLDLPMDVQRTEVDPGRLPSFAGGRPSTREPDGGTVDTVATLIREARRPVALAGGGVRLAGATGELETMAARTGIPVVATLLGLDAFPHDSERYAGMIGTYGNRYANLAIANADLVLVLGARLDTRQTGTRPETFAREAVIVHVDVDPAELGARVRAHYPVNADVGAFLRALNGRLRAGSRPQDRWAGIIREYRHRYPDFFPPTGRDIPPNYFIRRLSEHLPGNAIVCADIGQNQMWAAQSLVLRKGQRFLTQGGMAAMGSALPMAIGASFACPGRPVIVIAGDGGFQMNIQELQTVRHHGLHIKIIVINNGCYGMVRQFQEQYFGGRCQSTVLGYSCPDLCKVASAYGITASRIDAAASVDPALAGFFAGAGPAFLEATVRQEHIVTPKLAVNMPLEAQDPPLPPKELQALMMVAPVPEPGRRDAR